MSALPDFDPGLFLRGFVALRRLTGICPRRAPGHRSEGGRDLPARAAAACGARLDDHRHHSRTAARQRRRLPQRRRVVVAQAVRELSELGAHSVFAPVFSPMNSAAREFLASAADGSTDEPIADRLAAAGVSHMSFGRIVALDTRWRAPQWDDGPSQPLEPSYGEALTRAEQAFDTVASGRSLDAVNIRQSCSCSSARWREAARRSRRS